MKGHLINNGSMIGVPSRSIYKSNENLEENHNVQAV